MSSIETRPNPGSGTVSYRVRFRYQGRNKAVPFDTDRQAKAWQAVLDTMGPAAALRLLDDAAPPDTATVADIIAHHLDHLTGVDEGTLRRYRTIHADHLEPHFSTIAASELTRDDIARWVNEARLLSGKVPAPKTLRNWHALLSDALSGAVERGVIEANVAKGVRLPRPDEAGEEMVFLTYDEFGTLVEHTPEKWQALVILLAMTGIRFGEATALTVGALNRAGHSARIHTAWKQSGKQGAPKSKKSRRTVAVQDAVFDALEPHLAGREPHELVFTAARGGRVRNGNFYNQVWKPLMDSVEPTIHKRPRIHDLRHTYAAWAIDKGHPLPYIQRQMGHETIQTTVDTYGHLVRTDRDPLLDVGSEVKLPARRALRAVEA